MLNPSAGGWLRPLANWPAALARGLEREAVLARVVVAAVQGSAPREPGVCMLVGAAGFDGTIGGGQLEWEALALARSLLESGASPVALRRLVLAADLEQCCGGVVELWIERFTRADLALVQALVRAASRGGAALESEWTPAGVQRRIHADGAADAVPRLLRRGPDHVSLRERLDDVLPNLWLYGAGHVGQALVRLVLELPLRLTWIDSRPQVFPHGLGGAARLLNDADVVASVATAPAGTRYVVMTHSHATDYALCRAILERKDFAWAGVIGSKSKGARFRGRLARDGLAPTLIARLVCPIGAGISSKWPAAIAVGVAADLLRDLGAAAAAPPARVLPVEAGCAAGDCARCGGWS